MMRSSVLFLLMTSGFGPATNAFQQSAPISYHHHEWHVALHAEVSSSSDAALPPELQLAMERKNQSRQKFGLEPLSAPQFLELRNQSTDMQNLQQQKQQQQKSPTARNEKNFLQKMIQKGMEDTCYS